MLSALAGKNDTILPACGIGKDEFERVIRLFEELPNVNADALYKVEARTNRVHVYHSSGGTSTVCTKEIAPAIPFERLRRYVRSDAILINMVSGFDIALETLDLMRMETRDDGTPIHLDYHNLTLGVNERQERYRHPVETWRRWAFMTETVQLNEQEIGGLAGGGMSEEQTVGHLLSLVGKGVIVTRRERGVSVFSDDHKRIVKTDIAAMPLPLETDTTGSGACLGRRLCITMRNPGIR